MQTTTENSQIRRPNVFERRFISLNTCCDWTDLSRTAINKKRAAGTFPQAIQLGERRIAFDRDEVLAWMEERVAKSRKAAPEAV